MAQNKRMEAAGIRTLDRDGLAALIEQHYAGLLTLLRRKLRDEQLAADLLNQAFVTSLEHIRMERIADPSQMAGYVFQVAMNQLRNHRRKFVERQDRRASRDALDHLPADAGAPELGMDMDLRAKVRGLVAQLSTARDREIVKRFYLDEEDKAAICRDLGLSSLHFDKVIFRARQRMRALLKAKGFNNPDILGLLVLCFVSTQGS
jgi:RNA polymerase sigma-70 factor, ECF subfamily